MLKKLTLFASLLFFTTIIYAQESFIKVVKKGSAYKFEIPDSLLGESILFGSRVVDISSPSAKVYSAGQMRRPPVLIRFSKRDKLIVIEEVNTFVDVNNNDPIYDPLSANMRVGGVNYFDIESRNETNDASVIDVTKYFSEEVQLAWPLPDNVKKGRLDSKLSKLLYINEFNDRVNIRSYYEFLGGKETFTITVQYFLLRLPKEILNTRFSDSRVGYLSFNRRAYSSGKGIVSNKYITRWRIEPKPEDILRHKQGELVEPANPIIMYIEPYFPKDWIPYIKQGVEDWNSAFEKIGFKNVMQAREFPKNDPNFDPYDIKTNVIRYLPLDEANAAGQVWSDPRSGEIINGEVLWWNNVVDLFSMWRFTQTAAVDPKARAIEYDNEMMGEMVRYAIAHEVGHVLGLQHNMRSSYAYPSDSLRSASFTQIYGTTASIMDYARNNHIARPGDMDKGVKMTPPVLGPFDYLSIEFGYKYIHDVKTPEQELPVLDSIFKSKGNDPMYQFAPFIATPISPDPSAQSESLGDNVIVSSRNGILNTQIILDSLIDWTLAYSGSQTILERRYEALSKQYFRYITLSISYIGGKYTYQGPFEDGFIRHVPINKEKQKEALQNVIFWLREAPEHLDNHKFSTIMGSVTDNVLKRQSEIMESLVSGGFVTPRVLQNSSFYGEVYTLEEYLKDLDQFVWDSFCTSSIYDKNIQITYIQSLKNLSQIPQRGDSMMLGSSAIIADAAYSQVINTKKSIKRMMKGDKKSKEHYKFLLEILEKN